MKGSSLKESVNSGTDGKRTVLWGSGGEAIRWDCLGGPSTDPAASSPSRSCHTARQTKVVEKLRGTKIIPKAAKGGEFQVGMGSEVKFYRIVRGDAPRTEVPGVLWVCPWAEAIL